MMKELALSIVGFVLAGVLVYEYKAWRERTMLQGPSPDIRDGVGSEDEGLGAQNLPASGFYSDDRPMPDFREAEGLSMASEWSASPTNMVIS